MKTKADRVIDELTQALANILNEAQKENASRHYIAGAAEFALQRCQSQQVRNADGYLVVAK